MTKVSHNATIGRKPIKHSKTWLSYDEFLAKQTVEEADLKVEDRRVCLVIDKDYTQEEKTVLANMCKSSICSHSKYVNELTGWKFNDEFNKGKYYYSIYFFVKQGKLAIDTGNGNIPMILCSFNKYLREMVENRKSQEF